MGGYRVLGMLQDPYKASIVTNLSIKLRYIGTRSGISRLDKLFGEVLHNMVNLDSLVVWCLLCCKNRHHHLAKLGARRLRHLSVRCWFNTDPMLGVNKKQLISRFSNVEALKWSTANYWGPSSPLPGFSDPACFPKLNALEYNGKVASDILLATRLIRRLQIANVNPEHHPQLLASIKSSPGHLTHLIFKHFTTSKVIIEAAPSLFVQLQHLGSIPWLSQSAAVTFVNSELSILKLLPHLTSLDVTADFEIEWWTQDALTYLSKLHHKLRKVWLYTNDPMCLVWKRHDGAWERREVSSSSPWDIIRGICD
ncbi:hypothetical protein M408DRAFT_329678 [Serendipita vermifera MAFF 305830]|uniref:F-box domain-containing protein n=1 Tax=Serendipita vermifera MAFF 305830 TaxID=933852 RepID=A0A0C2XG04_SERVB|nr:hypothetical protein M408DRAFT_329678 [Serendipita vermifera MAFF 305830]